MPVLLLFRKRRAKTLGVMTYFGNLWLLGGGDAKKATVLQTAGVPRLRRGATSAFILAVGRKRLGGQKGSLGPFKGVEAHHDEGVIGEREGFGK